jgi:hypothetical protein
LKASINGSYVSLGAAGAANAFLTFDCEAGTDPVADSGTDTVILTGNSGSITVTGDAATDKVTFAVAALGVTAGMLAATLDISGKTLTLPTSQTLTTPTIASFANANHTHADAAGGGAITYVGNVLSTGNLTVNAAAGANTITIGNLSTGGIIVSDNMTVSAPVLLSGTNDISFYDANLKIWSSADGQLDLAGDVEVQVATATLDVNATTAALIDTAAYSIDATASSNVSVTGAQLQLSTITTGELDITAAELLDVNAGANIDIDVTGTFDMLSTGAISIDGTGASNVSATSGNLTVSTLTTGTLILDSVALLDMNAGANLDIDVTGTVDILSTGTLSIDSTGASNLSATSGNLTVSTITSGTLILGSAGIVDIDAGGVAAVTINTANEATADATACGSISLVAGNKGAGTGDGGSINLTAGSTTGGAAGTINLNSGVVVATAKAVSLGTATAIGGAFNIYRDGAGAKSVAVVPGTSITFVDNVVQTGAYTFGTGTGAVSINGDMTVTTGKDFAVVDGTVGLGSGAISTTYTTMVTNLNADKVDGKHVVEITAPSYICCNTSGAFGAATAFAGPGIETVNTTEENFFVAPTAGTITKMYAHLGTAPGGADTVAYTLRINGADKTVTCTISAANTTANDTAHTEAVSAGDQICVKAVSSAVTAADSSVTLEFRGVCA